MTIVAVVLIGVTALLHLWFLEITVSRRILLVQALPAALALGAVVLA